MNNLLQVVLSSFLGYDPYEEKVCYNSGNSSNGTYSWKFEPNMGLFSSLFQEIVMGTLVQL